MNKPESLARRALRAEWERLTPEERTVIEGVLDRMRASRDTNKEFLDSRTMGERLSDQIARFGGSWTFILLFASFLLFWALVNSEVLQPLQRAFDPYPYIFLNLILSMLAAIQAPIIMMSQNRQAARDRLQAANDYEVNLKAELEIRMLQEKFDQLREEEWRKLVDMQQEQIRLLEKTLEAVVNKP
ncbi:MAG: DUF1003 domain-containing protein [Gammaproteobacteria bacterium]